MKTLFKYFFVILSMMAMTIGFSACSNDDEGGSSSSIVGTWAYEEDYDGEYYYEEITFKANGTLIVECEESYYDDFDSWTERGTWEIDGDELIVEIDDEYVELRIISLTSKKLVLEDYDDYQRTYHRVND